MHFLLFFSNFYTLECIGGSVYTGNVCSKSPPSHSMRSHEMQENISRCHRQIDSDQEMISFTHLERKKSIFKNDFFDYAIRKAFFSRPLPQKGPPCTLLRTTFCTIFPSFLAAKSSKDPGFHWGYELKIASIYIHRIPKNAQKHVKML